MCGKRTFDRNDKKASKVKNTSFINFVIFIHFSQQSVMITNALAMQWILNFVMILFLLRYFLLKFVEEIYFSK